MTHYFLFNVLLGLQKNLNEYSLYFMLVILGFLFFLTLISLLILFILALSKKQVNKIT